MGQFVEYLNKISADNDLKEKTNARVQAALAVSPTIRKKEHVRMKKIVVAACSLAACAMLTAGGYALYETPVKYISLDINPSVELGVNAFDTVVETTAYNEDGSNLLENADVENLPVGDAVSNLVDEAAEEGYIAEDGSTVLAVTSTSEDEAEATELEETVEEEVEQTLKAKNIAAIVYADCSDPALRAEAKQLGISPGKYKLIKILQMLDPTITVDQYTSTKVTDIMTKAGQLLAMGVEIKEEKYNNALEKMNQAAEDAESAKQNGKGKNKGGAESTPAPSDANAPATTPSPEAEKEKNRNKKPESTPVQSDTPATPKPEKEKNQNKNNPQSTPVPSDGEATPSPDKENNGNNGNGGNNGNSGNNGNNGNAGNNGNGAGSGKND